MKVRVKWRVKVKIRVMILTNGPIWLQKGLRKGQDEEIVLFPFSSRINFRLTYDDT